MKKSRKVVFSVLVLVFVLLFSQAANAASRKLSEASVAKANAVVQAIMRPEMSDYEKAIAVHDWLCINCVYNLATFQSGTYLESDHNPDGPLLYGISVCEGYAEAYKLFMDLLGIKNRRVNGYAGGGYHGWNEVYINGQWFAVDVTWDDPIIIGYDPGGVYSRRYCMISPDIIALDHMACEYFEK